MISPLVALLLPGGKISDVCVKGPVIVVVVIFVVLVHDLPWLDCRDLVE